MSAIDRLLKPHHRRAGKADTRHLFDLLCASATEEKNAGVFVRKINGGWLEEIEYYITGPFSLEQDDYKIGPDEVYISGHCPHSHRQMDLRLVNMPDSKVIGVVEVRYHKDKWQDHPSGDLCIYIPKE